MNGSKALTGLKRLGTILVLTWIVAIKRNPLVRLEAVLGLSPSPLEKLFGVKGLFSGMTEGMFRLSHGDLLGSMQSNVLTPFVALAVVIGIAFGVRPRIRDRRDELLFFACIVFLSVVVNIAN